MLLLIVSLKSSGIDLIHTHTSVLLILHGASQFLRNTFKIVMLQTLARSKSGVRVKFQHFLQKIQSLVWNIRPCWKVVPELLGLNIWELYSFWFGKFNPFAPLGSSRGAQHCHNSYQLVTFRSPRKQRPSQIEFSHDAGQSEYVDAFSVIGRPQNQLRGSVPSRRHVLRIISGRLLLISEFLR